MRFRLRTAENVIWKRSLILNGTLLSQGQGSRNLFSHCKATLNTCSEGCALTDAGRALSRTGKKVLHIDKNDYYGGSEAALSLQEAKTWAEAADEGSRLPLPYKKFLSANPPISDGFSPFSHVTIKNLEEETRDPSKDVTNAKLGFSRAYSLSLSPQLIYTRSNLLPALVSSKVYRQLEFLAVGNWWIYSDHEAAEEGPPGSTASPRGSLRRIPGGREDVFADKGIDLRSTRSLMKFLKLAADPEAHESILEQWGDRPFPEFLESHFSIPPRLQAPLLALTLSPNPPAETLTSYALPRINRHLTSIGMFGPGFGSVIPKWGGLAEIAQVACRAGAVGGGVYVLKKGFARSGSADQQDSGLDSISLDQGTNLSTVRLEGGENVKSHWIVGSLWDLSSRPPPPPNDQSHPSYIARSITIVSGSLSQLFPLPAEGAPPPAGAVVFFPSGTLAFESEHQMPPSAKTESQPVYLMVHSSDTGECPAGQCKCTFIYYGSGSIFMMTQNNEYLSTLSAILLKITHF